MPTPSYLFEHRVDAALAVLPILLTIHPSKYTHKYFPLHTLVNELGTRPPKPRKKTLLMGILEVSRDTLSCDLIASNGRQVGDEKRRLLSSNFHHPCALEDDMDRPGLIWTTPAPAGAHTIFFALQFSRCTNYEEGLGIGTTAMVEGE